MASFLSFILPLAVAIVKKYIESSSSKRDDLILSTVQKGCYYLAPKNNNTVDILLADSVGEQSMVEEA